MMKTAEYGISITLTAEQWKHVLQATSYCLSYAQRDRAIEDTYVALLKEFIKQSPPAQHSNDKVVNPFNAGLPDKTLMNHKEEH